MTQPVERDFAPIERLLAGLIAPRVGGDDHVGNRTPDNLEQVLPFVRVVRVAGGRTALFDYPVVELDYFDSVSAADPERAASRLTNFLLSKPPPHPALDAVYCDMAPRELPWGDSDDVLRWQATLSCEMRQVRLPPLP